MKALSVAVGALCVFLSASAASAFPSCDAVSEALQSRIGAKFARKSPLMGNIFLTHPAADDVVVFCGPRVSVALAKDGAPTADYLRLATVAARFVTESNDRGLPAAIAGCLKAARRASDELGDGKTEHVSIECQSFVRDGGGNHITVSPNLHDD